VTDSYISFTNILLYELYVTPQMTREFIVICSIKPYFHCSHTFWNYCMAPFLETLHTNITHLLQKHWIQNYLNSSKTGVFDYLTLHAIHQMITHIHQTTKLHTDMTNAKHYYLQSIACSVSNGVCRCQS